MLALQKYTFFFVNLKFTDLQLRGGFRGLPHAHTHTHARATNVVPEFRMSGYSKI